MRILFICTGNSCRSQMAEGLARVHDRGGVAAFSAGSRPADTVSPYAVRVMAEKGIDISGHRPKSVNGFAGQVFDCVITLCDSAKQSCPYFPGDGRRLHWSIPDPYDAGEGEALAVYRRTRDDIEARIVKLLGEEAP